MSKYQQILLLTALFAVPSAQAAGSATETISVAGRIGIEKPAGWDVTKSENEQVFFKPLSFSGVGILKIWRFPPSSQPGFPRGFNEVIEDYLWQNQWKDPAFWQTEPVSENQQKYTGVATEEVMIRGTSWSYTRHSGKDVSDIVNCYRLLDGGVLAATYRSKSPNVSSDDAAQQFQDVQQILEGITVEDGQP